jgi:Bacterial DNA-binding protein
VHLDQREAVLVERQVERSSPGVVEPGRQRDRRIDMGLRLEVVPALVVEEARVEPASAPREGRNPATGETIQIAARRAAKFSAAAGLKQQLNG